MKSVNQILQQKPKAIFSVSSDISVFDGLKIMMEKNISALLVIDQEQLTGIFTERDYARKIILQGKSSKETKIEEVMTKNLISIKSSDSIEKCMEMMTEKHFRHLPVVDNGKLAGMISIGDVVKYLIEDQKQTIEHLKNYISG